MRRIRYSKYSPEDIEISSEDPDYPIESALLPGDGPGWRAASPGRQTIRLLFAQAQRLRRIRLCFVETTLQRTQEYVLRWSAGAGQSFQEIVRQQWNFDPQGASSENETHQVDLFGVRAVELIITPDIANGQAFASLARIDSGAKFVPVMVFVPADSLRVARWLCLRPRRCFAGQGQVTKLVKCRLRSKTNDSSSCLPLSASGVLLQATRRIKTTVFMGFIRLNV